MTVDFLDYELTARALYLGERAKGNLFKPCLRTIPYSAISGALNRHFGNSTTGDRIKAVGFLEQRVGSNRAGLLTYSPRDRVAKVSKIPLQVEFLADVVGIVLVVASESAQRLPEKFGLTLGGMRSHGFGDARLEFRAKRAGGDPRLGLLRVRLPEAEAPAFGIVKVQTPVYGYLFEPTPGAFTGVYVRSLFEGSRVVGPGLLLEPP